MDQQTLVTLIIGVVVSVLGLLYRYWKPSDPAKSWLEMGLSIIGAIVGLFVLGKLSLTPNLLNDPIKAIQFVLENAAVVFAFAQVIFNALKQQTVVKSGFLAKSFGK